MGHHRSSCIGPNHVRFATRGGSGWAPHGLGQCRRQLRAGSKLTLSRRRMSASPPMADGETSALDQLQWASIGKTALSAMVRCASQLPSRSGLWAAATGTGETFYRGRQFGACLVRAPASYFDEVLPRRSVWRRCGRSRADSEDDHYRYHKSRYRQRPRVAGILPLSTNPTWG